MSSIIVLVCTLYPSIRIMCESVFHVLSLISNTYIVSKSTNVHIPYTLTLPLRCSRKTLMNSKCWRSMCTTLTPPLTTSTAWMSWRYSRSAGTGKRRGSNLSPSSTTECSSGTAHEQPTLLVSCLRWVWLWAWLSHR